VHFDLTQIRHYVDARWVIEVVAFVQVVLIDLVMAGDNALAVGIAASNLPANKRKTAILLGLFGAVVVRLGFVLVTLRLFQVVGLVLAGGLLLLWVAQRMWRDLRHQDKLAHAAHHLSAVTGVDIAPKGRPTPPAQKRPRKIGLVSATIQILIADVSMSLDNILAVTGAARQHIWVLMFGLVFSIAAMGFAASLIAKVLNRVRWLGYAGVLIVFIVACRMVYDGAMQFWVVEQCDATLKCFPDTLHRTLDWWAHCPDHLAHFLRAVQKRFSS
jgi:YjbE family integral membrane protein